jgi:hypothetical protein
MYIDIVPNRNSPPAVLLHQAIREGKKVRKVTVANLSDWPEEQVASLRLLLKASSFEMKTGCSKILKTVVFAVPGGVPVLL